MNLAPKKNEDRSNHHDGALSLVNQRSLGNDDGNSYNPLEQFEDAPPKSKNVNRVLLYTFFAFSSRSLWNQSVLSAFVYLLKSDDPKFVGLITGIMGVSQLITSFPAGYLADRYRRDTLLKSSAIVGILGVILTIIAAKLEDFVFLGIALSFWGLFWGISNTAISALFADSIYDGNRSKYFTQMLLMQCLGNSTGPLGAFFMFRFLGNNWTIEECQIVLCIAQLLSLPGFFVLCFMSDNYIVTNTSYEYQYQNLNSVDELMQVESEYTIGGTYRSSDDGSSVPSNGIETPLLSTEIDTYVNNPPELMSDNTSSEGIRKSRMIPILVSLADILAGLSSGMSFRYFPIFFLHNMKMSPDIVQLIFLCSTVGMAISGQISQLLGLRIGSLETTILVRCLGAALLISMVICYQSKLPASLISILFILSSAISISADGLTRSVIMDSVPPQERAKWSAVESVNMFGWSGSAALGGFLVGWFGIVYNFYITASFQTLATIPLFLVLRKSGKL